MTELERWVGYGANLAGALTGSAIGAGATGDPAGAIIGAGIGSALEGALAEAGHRFTSHRQKQRIGAVVGMARNNLLDLIAGGASLRGDEFLRERLDGRSPADEVIEHVVQVAQRSFEERKLPHIAAVLANVAVTPFIDEMTAHWAIRMVDALSWHKLVALAILGEADRESPLPAVQIGKDPGTWTRWSAHKIFSELYYTDALAGYRSEKTEGIPDLGPPVLSGMHLTSAGTLLYQSADLNKISTEDRAGLLRQLEREVTPGSP